VNGSAICRTEDAPRRRFAAVSEGLDQLTDSGRPPAAGRGMRPLLRVSINCFAMTNMLDRTRGTHCLPSLPTKLVRLTSDGHKSK
jgi:hypothetical protein